MSKTTYFDFGRLQQKWDDQNPFALFEPRDKCAIGEHNPMVLPTNPPQYKCQWCGCRLEPATPQQPRWVEK